MNAPASKTPLTAVLEMHSAMDVPEGFRAEVVEGNIVLSPTPSGRHAWIVSEIHEQLTIPPGARSVQNVTIDVPATGERYVPDLVVLPRDVVLTDDWIFPPEHVLLAVEVVSPSNARTDRVVKPRGYASVAVPLYLLVDPLDRTTTLFSSPEGGVYREHVQAAFGKVIALPAPFDVAIDTSYFE